MSSSTASPTCAHCGTSDKERLYLREEHCDCCEGCLLDRCIGHKPTLDLAGLYSGFVEALVRTLDLRELETGLHSRRSACHTLVLARRIISDAEELRQIYWGALLHDIGKIGIPERILLKTGVLTAEEWLRCIGQDDSALRECWAVAASQPNRRWLSLVRRKGHPHLAIHSAFS